MSENLEIIWTTIVVSLFVIFFTWFLHLQQTTIKQNVQIIQQKQLNFVFTS